SNCPLTPTTDVFEFLRWIACFPAWNFTIKGTCKYVAEVGTSKKPLLTFSAGIYILRTILEPAKITSHLCTTPAPADALHLCAQRNCKWYAACNPVKNLDPSFTPGKNCGLIQHDGTNL
ncbi:MAG: hypothetical protein IPI60_21160, partial [Saprospiraceae bacterium]|nr:hypothetical protein [Saprospiraceae bacterium]